MSDASQRFIFEGTDVRGQVTQLHDSFLQVISNQPYPSIVSRLLGEFLAAAVLLSSTIKFQGSLILQVRSDGQIPMLMAESTQDQEVRAIARVDDNIDPNATFDQLFTKGMLAITIEPDRGERYQSLVPLNGKNLASCLEHYFEQSEQLQTWVRLAADDQQAGGFLIQQLPAQLVREPLTRIQQWQHLLSLAHTLRDSEVLYHPTDETLSKCFPDAQIRVFESTPITFACSCSEERTARALNMIDPAELESMLIEMGTIDTRCEFCGQQYHFTRELLAGFSSPRT